MKMTTTIKNFVCKYCIHANRTQILIRMPGETFEGTMVIFGKIMSKSYSIFEQKFAKSDHSAEEKKSKILIERRRSIYADTIGIKDVVPLQSDPTFSLLKAISRFCPAFFFCLLLLPNYLLLEQASQG